MKPNESLKLNEGAYPGWDVLVDSFYAPFPVAREILLDHSRAVAKLALAINLRYHTPLDEKVVVYAAMTHDIGIVRTHAPRIGCKGHEPYLRHGILGADMLRNSNAPEWAARVAERHTGTGITRDEILVSKLPLPVDRLYMPETDLEKLICYADKFFSKRPGHLSDMKDLETVRKEISAYGKDSLDRFEDLYAKFGFPG